MSIVAGDPQGTSPVHNSGEDLTAPIAGHMTCTGCGYALSALPEDTLPTCPACGGTEFRRARLFDQPTVDAVTVEAADTEPGEITAARADLASGIPHLAWVSEDDEVVTFALRPGWTRIGRSGSADVRLDDPTVSRRHALVVLTDEGDLRALDDRSLNGLFVNGERVEWAPLGDGDELEIGRYRIYLVSQG